MKQKKLKSIPICYYSNENKEKEAILFLHPAFANHHCFDEQFTCFSKQYHTVALDMIGHGNSQGIKTKHKIHNTREHIYEMLDLEQIKAVHLVGVSLGSLMAQDFANRYPERTLSLCAVGGYDINHFDKAIEKQNQRQQLNFMLKMLVSMDWFSKSNAKLVAIAPAAQDKFYEMNRSVKRSSLPYMSTLTQIMNRFPYTERTYPLSVCYGEFDNDLAILLSKKWHELEPDSRIITIINAGHCANMDNPAAFNEMLNEHLQIIHAAYDSAGSEHLRRFGLRA